MLDHQIVQLGLFADDETCDEPLVGHYNYCFIGRANSEFIALEVAKVDAEMAGYPVMDNVVNHLSMEIAPEGYDYLVGLLL